MCGVIGVFAIGGKEAIQLETAITMAHSMKHRGPDDEGYAVFSEGASVQSFYGADTPLSVREAHPELSDAKGFEDEIFSLLGHRRLSILDISPAGHQPMTETEGRYWIAFNGEIYNYLELRSQLSDLGHEFHTDTDTEVILAAFKEWGQDCTKHFNGDWAFLIFDNLNETLFVSRDRFGIKPLYFYQDDHRLIFASEIKALLANPNVETEPDLGVLNEYLKSGSKEWLAPTSFTKIQRFPHAHSALIDLKAAKKWQACRYYSLEANVENEKFDMQRAKMFAAKYLDILTDAVRIRMRSDVPYGCALSGGLDSSSVVFLAHQLMEEVDGKSKLDTFSMVHNANELKHYDESKFIDLLQSYLGFNSYRCEAIESDVPELLEKISLVMENPPNGLATAGIVTVGVAKDAGLVVTLDGQGADEVQAGYENYIINYLADLTFFDFFTQFIQFQKNYKGTGNRRFLISSAAMSLRILGLRWTNKLIKLFGFRGEVRFNALNAELLHSVNHNLTNLIHFADARSMHYSIESRMPFMDHRVIEFSLSIPACYKIHDGYSKYFARLAFDGKLPDEITWRKDKLGWPVPVSEWLNGSLKNWKNNIIKGSHILKSITDETLMANPKDLDLQVRYLNIAIWEKVFWDKNKLRSNKVREDD
jgi:asparagine synthase (glutamine-hydrolysing)